MSNFAKKTPKGKAISAASTNFKNQIPNQTMNKGQMASSANQQPQQKQVKEQSNNSTLGKKVTTNSKKPQQKLNPQESTQQKKTDTIEELKNIIRKLDEQIQEYSKQKIETKALILKLVQNLKWLSEKNIDIQIAYKKNEEKLYIYQLLIENMQKKLRESQDLLIEWSPAIMKNALKIDESISSLEQCHVPLSFSISQLKLQDSSKDTQQNEQPQSLWKTRWSLKLFQKLEGQSKELQQISIQSKNMLRQILRVGSQDLISKYRQKIQHNMQDIDQFNLNKIVSELLIYTSQQVQSK